MHEPRVYNEAESHSGTRTRNNEERSNAKLYAIGRTTHVAKIKTQMCSLHEMLWLVIMYHNRICKTIEFNQQHAGCTNLATPLKF